MPKYKHSFFLTDDSGLYSNIYYINIYPDGEIYIKANNEKDENLTHISIHKSGIKHVKENNIPIHKWKKEYKEQNLYIEHSLIIYKNQLHDMKAENLRTDCVKIIIPDKSNLVHLILTRAPKNLSTSHPFSIFEKNGEDTHEYPYEDIIVEERTENNNYKLCARFESVDESICNSIISEEKKKILDSTNITKLNLLKERSVMVINEEDGVVFSPTYLELFFTSEEIEHYKLSIPNVNP